MPGNVTLESLEIEVKANSQRASEGIGSLIGSLRSMAMGVGTVVPALKELNKELKTLARYGSMKLPNFTAIANSTKKKTASSAVVDMAHNNGRGASVPGWALKVQTRSDEWNKNLREDPSKTFYENHPEALTVARELGNVNQRIATANAARAAAAERAKIGTDKLTESTKDAVPATNQIKESTKEVAKAANDASKKTSKLGGSIQQIGRIAKTMLIRTVLRSLMKAFSQSWQAAYEFSNKLGGSFAKSVDATRAILADTVTSVVQAFAPAFEALVPVFYVVGQAIQYLCEMFKQLMQLFGLTSDIMGAATSSINKYTNSSKNAGKANKNMLASWDKLNVIQSKGSAGSGSGNTYKPGSLANLVGSETNAIMSVIVGEAMMAVGLILCVTGHIGAGAGLIAVGAASVAKTLIADWGKLPVEVKKTIAKIMTIVGVSSLALGVILLCCGQIPLGIGLVALGLANIAGILAATNNQEDIANGVRKTVTDILKIVGGAGMLALGVILTVTGSAAIGIPLILQGGYFIRQATGIDWDMIVDKVKEILTNIGKYFEEKFDLIKKTIGVAWDVFAQWFDNTILAPIRAVWDVVSSYFIGLFDNIKLVATSAWNVVYGFWTDNIYPVIAGAWDSVSTFFATLFGDSKTAGSIAFYAVTAWDLVKELWTNNVARPFEQAWDTVTAVFTTLFADSNTNGSIAYYAMQGWNAISYWWGDTLAEPIQKAWNAVTGVFEGIFGTTETEGTIAYYVNKGWEATKQFWETDIKGNVEKGWGFVSSYFKDIWEGKDGNGGIKQSAIDAWNAVAVWWNTNVAENVQKDGAWGGVVGFMKGVFYGDNGAGGIKGAFINMWNSIKRLWGDITTPIKEAWEGISNWFYEHVTLPVANFFIDLVNGIINGVNSLIKLLNSVNITVPALNILGQQIWGETKIGISGIATIKPLQRLKSVNENAGGAYDIPRGDLFIANEAGAELVGQMNGKTTVANQDQIIQGIQRGVRDANADQNALLRQQNELLRGILERSGSIEVHPSADWGKFNQRSNEMWSMATGR